MLAAMTTTAAARPPELGVQFEQLLFERSPLGAPLTVMAIFTALFGSFLVLAAIERIDTVTRTANGVTFSNAAWPALVLSLLVCAALGMQRYARLSETRDAASYARILSGGMASATQVTNFVPPDAKLELATLIGILLGLGVSAIIWFAETQEGHGMPPLALIWFSATTTFLVLLFVRGIEQTRAGGRSYAATLNAELKIDLLRTDALSVLGRSAARTALIWLVVSAVACLFFVGGDLNWLTVALIVACAGIGLGVFVNIMARIHRLIANAKRAELERVRGQIDRARHAMHDDAGAAARVQGLLAYEARIQAAPEWPFDQSTATRVAFYLFIPIVPWFGQAAAQFAVEHFAR